MAWNLVSERVWYLVSNRISDMSARDVGRAVGVVRFRVSGSVWGD